jgi:hypothetical protein
MKTFHEYINEAFGEDIDIQELRRSVREAFDPVHSGDGPYLGAIIAAKKIISGMEEYEEDPESLYPSKTAMLDLIKKANDTKHWGTVIKAIKHIPVDVIEKYGPAFINNPYSPREDKSKNGANILISALNHLQYL